MKAAILPAILLVMIGIVRWQIWKRDNPPVTAADIKFRRILENSQWITLSMDSVSHDYCFSQQKQTLISHVWLAPTPVDATYPQSPGEQMVIVFRLPKGKPGQEGVGRIALEPDAAFSSVEIEHSNPYSAEGFYLRPASNRFLRAWISAGAP